MPQPKPALAFPQTPDADPSVAKKPKVAKQPKETSRQRFEREKLATGFTRYTDPETLPGDLKTVECAALEGLGADAALAFMKKYGFKLGAGKGSWRVSRATFLKLRESNVTEAK